jgi:hypothetical protein
MAMMGSAAWSGQDHAMQSNGDDDFQQFLDISSMANLADGLQFDFQDFHGSNGGPNMMAAPHRQAMDTPMSGTDNPDAMPSRGEQPTSMNMQMPPMTTAAGFQSIPTTMMPAPSPNEAIVDSIDAQIQFLQQQKLQHQQRQLEEQQAAAFFAQQRSNIVPPTPQSLELLAGNNHFYGQSGRSDGPSQQQGQPQHPQQQQQPVDYRYQRLKEQQEVGFGLDGFPEGGSTTNPDCYLDVIHTTCFASCDAA